MKKIQIDSSISISDMEIENISKKIDSLGPLIIEITGIPNSGKTNALKQLDIVLKKYCFNSIILYEATSKCKIKNKFSPQFNYWTACETIKALLESVENGYKIIICERGVFDAICWMQVYLDENMLSKNDYEIAKSFYKTSVWTKYFKYLFIMKCSYDVVLERDRIKHINRTEGTIINQKVINAINIAIEKTLINTQDIIEYYSVLDTTKVKQKVIINNIINSVLSFINIYYNG